MLDVENNYDFESSLKVAKDLEKLNFTWFEAPMIDYEFENYKKRISKDQESIAISTISMFALSLLPLVDSFENALEQGKGNENIKALYNQLINSLDAIEITEVPGVGSPFDPNFHEAMFEIPSDDHEPGIIIQVIEHGYVLENRLLRAAKVGVSSKKNEEKPN